MTLSLQSRPSEADLEPPMRSPEQLALALPLVAVIGVMIVVAAVATGGSAHFVAIAAVGGFALCAVAPMALLDAFVGRPLRAALGQLRAARDGQPAPGGRPFAFGLIGDLVQLAADIRAAQSNPSPLAQSPQFVELAEAIKGLRASPAGGALDGAVERIETMLVYIAESLERRETHEKDAVQAFGRVERGFTDMARLLSRETEALQGSVSSAALLVRNDIASTAAEDKVARTRALERLESFEARVLARLADPAPPDLGKFAELIRNEAESTRRALRERIETGAPVADVRRLDEVATHLALVTEQISQRLAAVDETAPSAQGALFEAAQRLEEAAASLEARAPQDARSLDEAIGGIGRDVGQRLAAAEARLVERIGGAEAVRLAGPSEGSAALHDLRADLRALADVVAGIAARTEAAAHIQAERVLEGIAASLEAAPAPSADLAARIEALAGAVAALGAPPAEAGAGFDRRELDHILQNLIAATQTMAKTSARLDGSAGGSADLADLRADLGAFGDRLERQTEAQASRLEAIESRVVAQIIGIERDESATTLTALLKTTKDLRVAIDRLDALSARSAPEGGLKSEVRGVGEAVAALAKRLDGVRTSPAQALVGGAAERSAPEGRLDGVLAGIGARLDALSGAAAKTADLAALRTEIAGVGERVGRAVAEMATQVQAAARSEADRVVVRIAALDTGALQGVAVGLAETQSRLDVFAARIESSSANLTGAAASCADALEAAGGLAQTQARLDACAARIEAGGAALADVAARDAAEWPALREDLAKVAESALRAADLAARVEAGSRAQADRVVGRLDALDEGTLERTRAALAETEMRWSGHASRFEAGVSALTVLAATGALDFAALRGEIAAIGEAVARGAAELSARIETSSQSVGRDVAEALHALAEAGSQWDQLAGKIEALATAEAPTLAELERAVGETASRAVEAAASRFGEASRAHSARLIERFAELDRGAVNAMLSAFDAITKDLADTRARLDGGVEAGLADLKRIVETVAGLAARFDALAAARPERAPAADLDLDGRGVALDRGAVASALGEFQAMTRNLAEAVARFEAATAVVEAHSGAPAGRSADFEDLRRELAAVGEQVAAAVLRLDGRLDDFAAAQAGGHQGLETRPDAASIAVVRAIAGDPSRESASIDGAGLAAFRAMTRTLQEATERFEAATATVCALPAELDGRIEGLARGQAEGFAGLEQSLDARTQGLASMKEQLAAALTRLEETASNLDRGAGPQIVVTQLDTSLLTELRGDLREVGARVAEALAGFAGKLESSAAAPSAAPSADWRQDIASLADLIADLERRLTSEPSAPPASAPPAMAKIVASFAGSLDFRFAEIETGLAELCSRLPAFDAGGDLAAAGLASLVGQITAASEVLKAGLSELVAVSAALAEETGARELSQDAASPGKQRSTGTYP